MIAYLAAFAFPFSVFAIGGYLIFRGISKSETRSVSGKAKPHKTFKSPVSGKNVTYSKLVIEAYQGGHTPWKEIYKDELKMDFILCGKNVSMEFSDVRITVPLVLEGYIRRKKGDIEEFGEYLYRWAGYIGSPGRTILQIARSLGSKGELRFLDDALVGGLMSEGSVKAAIEKNIRKPLRISEFTIEDGTRLCVASNQADLRGTMEHPLLITDTPENDARFTMEEKARTSILLGAGLVLFAFVLSFFLFLSLKPF
jgi:hypothetical protein